jgi:DNA-binding IclR family transcriptional regulator
MLENAMRVLELFSSEHREIGVVEAASRLRVPKSTLSRWLSAMAAAGFLDRDVTSGRYRLSMRIGVLGELARSSTSLQRLARRELQWLAATTGETANLAVLVGADVLNVEAVESPRPVIQTGWVGRRLPCHATAAGKALLAWLDPAHVRQLLPESLPKLASRTILSVEEFVAELARVRTLGYSVAWGELEDDLAAIAAPVRDHTGLVVGAITIGGPVFRIAADQLEGYSEPVVRAASTLSAQLGFRYGRPIA